MHSLNFRICCISDFIFLRIAILLNSVKPNYEELQKHSMWIQGTGDRVEGGGLPLLDQIPTPSVMPSEPLSLSRHIPVPVHWM